MSTSTLTEKVKRKLNITWSDADTDARVAEIMDDARAAMMYKLGISDTSFDFSTAGQERVLYLAYCFYLWNHAENEFDAAYIGEIMQCRRKYEVGTDDEED